MSEEEKRNQQIEDESEDDSEDEVSDRHVCSLYRNISIKLTKILTKF